MKSPHLHLLAWLAVAAYVAAIVLTVIAAGIDPWHYGFRQDDPAEVVRKAALGGLADLALLTGIASTLLAITLAGVRHLLTQAASRSADDIAAMRSAGTDT